MAKLKIFENNDPTHPIPNKDGYRKVARRLLADLPNFKNASDKDRSDLLRRYANDGGANNIIFQRTRNPENEVPIDASNCRVILDYDERISPAAAISEHHMVLPKQQAGDPPIDPGYLDKYIEAIVSLYGATGGGSTAQVTAACEFLFGLMMLTRCR